MSDFEDLFPDIPKVIRQKEIELELEEATRKEQERLRAIEEENARRNPQVPKNLPIIQPSPVIIPTDTVFSVENASIEKNSFGYVMSGVPLFRGCFWSKELLDDGKQHNINEWNEYCGKNRSSKGWSIPSGPAYTMTLYTLQELRKTSRSATEIAVANELWDLLKDDVSPSKPYMMTSTVITYSSLGGDHVIHEYGSKNNTYDGVIVGDSGNDLVSLSDASTVSKLLLGDADVSRVRNVYHELTGMEPRVWRLRNKPDSGLVERSLLLGCGSGRFGIIANYINCYGPARGWSSQKNSSSP